MTLFDKWSQDPGSASCSAYATPAGSSQPTGRRVSDKGRHDHRRPGRAAREQTGGDFDTSHYAGRPGAATCTCASTTSPTWTTVARTSSTTIAPAGWRWADPDPWPRLAPGRQRRGPAGSAPASAPTRDRSHWSANDDGSPYYPRRRGRVCSAGLLEYLGSGGSGSPRPGECKPWCSRRWPPAGLAARAGNLRPGPPICEGVDEDPRISFFMPHHNESGYWWRGERPAGLPGRHGFAAARHFPSCAHTPDDVRPAPARLDPQAETLQRLHAGGARHQQPELHRRLSQCAGDLQRHHRRVDDELRSPSFPRYKDRLDQELALGAVDTHAAWFALAISWQSTPELVIETHKGSARTS